MLSISPSLARRLQQRNVGVEASDPDSVVLKQVPTDGTCFSKSHTNLLLIRPREGLPFLVCVDEDLEYSGDDDVLVRAFASAAVQRGWRVLSLAHPAWTDLHRTLEYVLGVLGFNRVTPGVAHGSKGARHAAGGTVLNAFGRDLTADSRAGILGPTLSRTEEVQRIVSTLLGWQARLPIVTGSPGVGKTNLLGAVARELERLRPSARFVTVHLGAVMAGIPVDYGREQMLGNLLNEIGEAGDLVCALENLDMGLGGGPHSLLLLCRALDHGLRLVGTVLPGSLCHVCVGPLARRVEVVRLEELPPSESLEVLRALQHRILDYHGVTAEEGVVEAAAQRALDLPGRLPAKAIALLDAAAARASIAGEPVVNLFHVYAAGAQVCEAGGER